MDAAVDRLDSRVVRNELLTASPVPSLGPGDTSTLNGSFSANLARMYIAQGGWSPTKRPGDPKYQRLWERYPNYRLRFSSYSQQLLTALLAQPVLDGEQQLPRHTQLTLGDQVALFLVARLLVRAGLGEAIQVHGCFEASALCRIAFPQYIDTETLDLIGWGSEDGLCTLEGLHGPLGECLLHAERAKMRCFTDEEMIRIGTAQRVSAQAYLDFVHTHGRPDLGEIYLRAIEILVQQHHHGRDWISQLGAMRSIGQRSRAAQGASSTLRLFETFEHWFTHAQSTSFLDDDYPRQQILLSQWEQRLPILAPIIEQRLRELDPLAVVATG